MLRRLTQTQLAEMIGTRQPSIARLENGSSIPSLSFLNKIAMALDAKIEVNLVVENYYANHRPPGPDNSILDTVTKSRYHSIQ